MSRYSLKGGELLVLRVPPAAIAGLYRGLAPETNLSAVLADCTPPTMGATMVRSDDGSLAAWLGASSALTFTDLLNAVAVTFSCSRPTHYLLLTTY